MAAVAGLVDSPPITPRFPMSHIKRGMFLTLSLLLLPCFASAGEFFEVNGVALGGYDPVAYFEVGKPTPGLVALNHEYLGSVFLFSSKENRSKFRTAPEKYAPQFGGFCALGTANGYKVKTEPDAFKVVDGKLYFNYNRKVLELWTQDQAGYIKRANENWPDVAKQPMKQ
jgi:YHS domain-containing protein